MKRKITDLPVVAPEMLDGLRVGAELRARILDARRPALPQMWPRFAAVACAGAVALVIGVAALVSAPSDPGTVPIEIHAAGENEDSLENLLENHFPTDAPILLADVPGGSLTIGSGSASTFRSLFTGDAGNFSLIGFDGGAYRMLSQPGSLGSSALGNALGSVSHVSDPSQADSSAWFGLISNAADDGATVYAVSGLSPKTAVAAEVGGNMRLFQRFTYSGYGPSGGSLESVLDVRGKVKSLDLSGVGKITDSATANALINTLLDNAVFKGNDVTRSKEALNIELNSGLVLQLLVSQNTFSACGSWSCPEFITAFQAAIN
ncbi:MAG: hypothetical protein FWD25_02480 [Clostridia bacterium]|nr:hypothetical protein [Clostridia bacterium]